MSRVLIIDDDEAVCETVSLMLAADGHESCIALTGEDGLRQIEKFGPDVLLVDLFMPGKDGIETIREVRRQAAGLPIVAMSGGGSRRLFECLEMAQKLGATCTLQKPFTLGALSSLLADALTKTSAGAVATASAGASNITPAAF